jgi:hypothetical protein
MDNVFFWREKVAPSSIQLTTNSQQPTANSLYYDLSGRKVACNAAEARQLRRGIYIHNGKKIVIR